jgi:DNA-binding transcriptional regulator LsrR (DeoR family)
LCGWRPGRVVGTTGSEEGCDMTIPDETEASILRLHYVEKWPKNTIANQIGVHHSVVERVLIQHGVSAEQLRVRPSMVNY